MNRTEPEAACSRLVEEVALGIAGMFASGDLSERSVDLIVDILEECWRRSREETLSATGVPTAARRHPKIEGLLAALVANS